MRGSHARLGRVVRAAGAIAVVALLGVGAPAGFAEEVSAEAAAKPDPGAAIAEQEAVLKSALQTRIGGNTASAEVQKQIDEISDEVDALSAQVRTTQKQIDSIRKFNDRMRELVGSQDAELASVDEQLDRVDEVGRSVTPLMLRMIDALQAFVELDVPFLLEERGERIADLRILMNRADVTGATKYRQIMEAYQIENEYGRTIESYRGVVEAPGGPVTADVLRFGRIALVYQSLDGTQSGVWNQQTRAWELLDSSYHNAVRDGIRVARKLIPPDLIEIPLPPADADAVARTAQVDN